MSDYYFFTEPDKLNSQIAAQSFGAIDANQFNIGNTFSATSDPKAIAVTDGVVLVQEISGVTDKVNLILRPLNQPDLDFPKISYYFYKGIKKTSLINGQNVAAPASNQLTEQIWDSFNQQVNNLPDPPTAPNADEILGTIYRATATDSFQAMDEEPLSDAFFNDQGVLFPVAAGDHIGDFDSSSLGFSITLERIGFEPTFGDARKADSLISFTALPAEPTSLEAFTRKHEKEVVLNYLDSTAFFGSFVDLGIKVIDGAAFIKKSGDDILDSVIDKHFNKNKIYLDIRNDYEDSFNYYLNYGNEIFLNFDLVANSFNSVNYYANEWPVITISDSEFAAGNTEKSFRLALPKADNDTPAVYFKKLYKPQNSVNEPVPGSERFSEIEIEEGMNVISEIIQTPRHSSSNTVISNYYQIKYYRRFTTPQAQYDGLSFKKDSYLDNLFPIFDMKIPFVTNSDVDTKIYYDTGFMDKSDINETEFTINLGVSVDSETINFIAYPQYYNTDEANPRDVLPLSGEQSSSGDNFIDYFNKKIGNQTIERRTFVLPEGSEEYYSFALDEQNIDEASQEESGAVIIHDAPPIGKSYDLENTNIISFSIEQFLQLFNAKEREFENTFRVSLGVANVNFLTNNSTESTTAFVLRGLKLNRDGVLVNHEYNTGIEVFAEDDLFNWDEERILTGPTSLDFEERFHLTSSFGGQYITQRNGSPTSTFQHLYETVGSDLKTIVDSFDADISALTSVNFEEQVQELIINKGTELLDLTRTNIRQSSNNLFGKDGALYLARLQMRKALKENPLSATLEDFVLKGYLNLLERVTRGLHESNLPDFSTHPTHIPILISGYDPFFSAFQYDGYFDPEFHVSNPSGNIALALNDEEIIQGSKKAIIKSAIFPVRFHEFNQGWIEGFFEPYVNPNHPNFNDNITSGNPVKMIITFSYGGTDYFNIDRFASRFRNPTLPGNNKTKGGISDYLTQSDKDNKEFIETTLPFNDMHIPNRVFLSQEAKFEYTNEGVPIGIFREIGDESLSPLIDFPNIANYPATGGVTADGIAAREGSGGDYLSNEIYYRVAFLRSTHNSGLQTGHIHVGFLRKDDQPDRAVMLSIIKDSLKQALTNL